MFKEQLFCLMHNTQWFFFQAAPPSRNRQDGKMTSHSWSPPLFQLQTPASWAPCLKKPMASPARIPIAQHLSLSLWVWHRTTLHIVLGHSRTRLGSPQVGYLPWTRDHNTCPFLVSHEVGSNPCASPQAPATLNLWHPINAYQAPTIWFYLGM